MMLFVAKIKKIRKVSFVKWHVPLLLGPGESLNVCVCMCVWVVSGTGQVLINLNELSVDLMEKKFVINKRINS